MKYGSIAAVAAFACVTSAQQPKRVDSEALKNAAKNGGDAMFGLNPVWK